MKQNTCPRCGELLVTIDYPEMIEYHNSDAEWGVLPTLDDPGM